MYKTVETAVRNLEKGENIKNKTFELMRDNHEFMSLAIKQNHENVRHIGSQLNKSKDFALDLINNIAPEIHNKILNGKITNETNQYKNEISSFNREIYSKVNEKVFDDLEVSMSWVKLTGSTFELSKENQNNVELYKESVLKKPDNSYSYRDAGPNIKENYQLTYEAVSNSKYAYEHAPDYFKLDRNISLKAFENGTSIGNIPVEFRTDKEIFTACLNNDSITMGFNKNDTKEYPLLNDKEFIKEYISNYKEIKSIKYESNFCGSKVFNICGEDVRNDKEIALMAINQTPYNINSVGEYLEKDRDVIMFALDKNYAPRKIHPELSNDKELMVKALNIDDSLLKYASKEIKDDNEIVLSLLKKNDWHHGIVSNSSERIKDLCKDKDPIKVLESCILADKLQNELIQKQEIKQKQKFKI